MWLENTSCGRIMHHYDGTMEPKYKYLSKRINNLMRKEDNFVCITLIKIVILSIFKGSAWQLLVYE